jgi:hypothetical protein
VRDAHVRIEDQSLDGVDEAFPGEWVLRCAIVVSARQVFFSADQRGDVDGYSAIG